MSIGVRLGVIAAVFTLLFSVLTFALWSVQVVEGSTFAAQADNNQIKVVDTPAPRGEIRDAKGRLLAGTRPALAAIVDGGLIPRTDDPEMEQLIQRLSALGNMPVADVRTAIDDARSRGDRIILASHLTDEQVLTLVEYQENFPGITVEPQPVRTYPFGELASDVLGYIGRPNENDIEKPEIGPTDTVGRAGVEREYDDDLRGTAGRIFYGVDAQRDVVDVVRDDPPQPGYSLELTVDVDVQAVLEESLLQGLEVARTAYGDPECVPSDADPGCPVRAVGVVQNVNDGSIVAMASVPSYDPNIFVDGLTQDELDQLSGDGLFNNFAIQGSYPPASAFKAIAYVLALEEGIFPGPASSQTPDGGYFCDGQLEFAFTDGSQQVYNDWTPVGHDVVDVHGALQTSCDLYFWEVALAIWRNREAAGGNENLLQEWSRQFGFDSETGIDLPFEQDGLIPDRAWFERAQRETPALVRTGPWTGGDVMNAVIGQGSVLVTPLQLANAYAAIVNGGTLYQPRVVRSITDQNGATVRINEPQVLNEIDLSPQTVAFFRRDLQQVVNGPRGTARSAFVEFGPNVEQVGGKTGTAEIIKGETADEDVDTAVFVGVAPITSPEYVVLTLIERGGSGGQIAAPTARRVLQYLVNGESAMTPIVEGEEVD
jgi:penicillin-binding protein 2